MKSNRTSLFLLLSIPLFFLVASMEKTDASLNTFRPNSALKTYTEFMNPDTLGIDKVPYMDLMRMVAKYRDERQKVINNHFRGTAPGQYGENFEDSRYYYISLASLERYISYIKRQVAQNELNVQFTGIRIYPIVYTNTGSSPYYTSIPSIYRNHMSIVFTSTYMDSDGYAIDFDPDIYTTNPNGPGNVPKSLEKQDTQSVSAFMATVFGGPNGEFSAQDHVWMCPPPQPCNRAAALSNADVICPDNTVCPY